MGLRRRNDSKPLSGIETQSSALQSLLKFGRNDSKPLSGIETEAMKPGADGGAAATTPNPSQGLKLRRAAPTAHV